MTDFDPIDIHVSHDMPEDYTPSKTSGTAIASLILGLSSCVFMILTAIPGLILGIVALVQIGNSRGRLRGKGMAITGIVFSFFGPIFILLALLLPAIQAVREAARRNMSSSSMLQVGMAMLFYEQIYDRIPAAGVDKQGEGPQISWRVQMLPLIEEQGLFDEFTQNEPWDSKNNKPLIKRMPPLYENPNGDIEPNKTNYLAVTGPGTMSPGGKEGIRPEQIRDGMANTVMLVEADADQAVVWTKPKDWRFDPKNPRRGLGSYRPRGFIAVFADGRVQFISNDVDKKVLSALFTRDGGERVDVDSLFGP